MGTLIRRYDIDKKNSFISAADNRLQQLSLINNKCNEWKTKYSDISEQSDFCYKVNCYFKKITEIVENSKSSITDVYTYAAMDNNDTYIKLRELNTKLEMINLELKPLTGITKPECNFYNTNFADFITPDKYLLNEIISKRLEYYSIGVNWRFFLQKDPSEISQEEYKLLAVIYLDEMNTIEMNIFLESQIKYVEDNVDIKYGYIDKEISFNLNEYIIAILNADVSKLSEIKDRSSDEYISQKEIVASHMQKSALIKSIYSVDKFYDFGAIAKIEKLNDEYIFHYYNNVLGDYTDGNNNGRRVREITVSKNLYSGDAEDEEIKKLKNVTQAKFNKSLSEVALEEFSINPQDELVGKSGDGIKAITKNKFLAKYGGVVVGKLYNTHKKYLENKENLNCYMNIYNGIDFAKYFDWFGLNVVYCDTYENNLYNKAELSGREVFVRQSPLTYEVIERFNKCDLAVRLNGGNKITLSDVMNDADHLRKVLQNLKDSDSQWFGQITTGA